MVLDQELNQAQSRLYDWARNHRRIATAGLAPVFRGVVEALGPETVVVEFGVRFAVSTIAWLSGGARLYSYDIEKNRKVKARYGDISDAFPGQWTFQRANTLDVEIPECDILFVDDLHNYEHVKKELALHADKVRGLIFFHDVTTLGAYGQPAYDSLSRKPLDAKYGREPADAPRESIPGVRMAIDELLIAGKWQMARSEWGHNGLVVVERVGGAVRLPDGFRGVYV